MHLLSKFICRKLLGLIFVGLFLTSASLLPMAVKPVLASPGFLTFKWKVNPGNTITVIGPLAADLLPNRLGLEIVVTGGSTSSDTTKSTSSGSITVLDGTTGKVIWSVKPAPIGIHQPFEIHDLNKDGIPEIIVSAWDEVLALHGNNGSVYWRTAAPVDGTYPAIADINNDGYPEIFVSGGKGPQQGYDYFTLLSHDGRILRQNPTSWHPCYGGLTIGDANFDGKFELYQGDRSSDYYRAEDPYKGGGKGLRALDAETLTPLWNDATILCSSHAPILADVDRDGILDVIAVDQPAGAHVGRGPVVLKAKDGSVLTTGGKYRYGTTERVDSHSQPTVHDIDGDGNLEIINSHPWEGGTATTIWDLYAWKMDARLLDEYGNYLLTAEPPKVGDVTGDGKMDIIAVTGWQDQFPNQRNSIYIYSYDKISRKYVIVEKVTGLNGARPFTLLQDVDNDGYNELILTSGSGNIYCYDTAVQAPSPRVRSGLQFYSEYKRGAAEYVPPPRPAQPLYKVGLKSVENNTASSNLGSITFEGVLYSLPDNASKPAGVYSARYSAAGGYLFVRWETSGLVSASNPNVNPTTVTVSGDGELKAVYSKSAHIFESGFETGDFSEWDGTSTTAGETASVVQTLPYEGQYGARFTSNGDGGAESAVAYKNLSPAMSELYASAYVYVDITGIGDNTDRHWFILFTSASSGLAWAGWFKSAGALYWALMIRDGANWVKNLKGTPSTGQWYSVGLHWVKDGTKGYGELLVNGNLQCSVYNKDTNDFGDASVVRFGLDLSGCASTTAYIDSAVIDKNIGPVLHTVGLESREDNVASSNLGSITFDGVSYTLPNEVSKPAGIYSAQYSAGSGYSFFRWETTGSVSVSDVNLNPTSVTVSGSGTLKAVYKKTTYTVGLESREDTTASSNFGSITLDSVSYALPNSVSKPAGTYSVRYIAGLSYVFDHWETTGSISVSDTNAVSTMVTVSGNGTLKAIYTVSAHIFESGFETGNFAEWDRISTTAGETAAVVQTLPYEGQYGARFTSNGGGGAESAVAYKNLSPARSNLYASAYVYVDTTGIGDNTDRHWFILFTSASSGLAWAGWFKSAGALYWALMIRDGANWVKNLKGTPSVGKWYFVELRWVMDGTKGYGELWVDGSLQCSVYNKDTDDFGDASVVRFGLDLSGCASTLVHMDSAVIDKAANRPPAIDSFYPLTDPAIFEGGSQEFNVTYSDLDGDSLTVQWYLNGTPTVTTSSYTVVADYNSAGVYNVTVVVSDGLAQTSHEWALTVTNVNRPPTIDSYTPLDPEPEVNEGSSLEFTHTSSDPDGDLLSYSWLLDGTERAISQNWTYSPGYDEAGTHNVTLVVSDGYGGFDSQQWDVIVNNVYTVGLGSQEDNDASSDLGSITFDAYHTLSPTVCLSLLTRTLLSTVLMQATSLIIGKQLVQSQCLISMQFQPP